jgi:hypothetical protein
MNFSVISSMILLWGIFLWASLGSLVKCIIVLLWSGTWYPFSSFYTISSIKLFCFVLFLRSVISFSLFLPIAPVAAVQLCPWFASRWF